jgi:hypothetical protein
MMLDDRRAIISGRGTAFDGQADVMHTALVAAAGVTLHHGYRYFAIMGSQDTSRAGVLYMPTQTYTSGTVNGYGNSASFSGMSTTTGGNAIPFVRPGMDVEIYMYRDGEVRPGPQIWDAQSIMAAQPKERNFP